MKNRPDIRITARTVKVSDSRLEVHVLDGGKERVLFFESDQKLWPQKPGNDNYAAVALSLHCANKKKDLFINGTLTESVLRNLDEYIKIWSVWRPDLYSPIKITAAQVVPDTPGSDKPAVLSYSGGVDASFALAAHQTKLFGERSRDIGLGVLMIGYDIQESEEKKLKAAHVSAKRILDYFGVKCALMSSNWREDFSPHDLTAYLTGIAGGLHTLVNDYAVGMIANEIDALHDIDLVYNCWHLSVINLPGSDTFPIVSTGTSHTRQERVRFISKFPVVVDNLRVCWVGLEEGTNCGVCSKCIRTRLELMVFNLEPDVFNAPMGIENILGLSLKNYEQLLFLEETYLEFDKNHPWYEALEEVYLRERKKLEETGEGLLEQLEDKNKEAGRLADDLKAIKNTKSYRLAAALRRETVRNTAEMQQGIVRARTVRVSDFRLEAEISIGDEIKTLYFESDCPFWEKPPDNDDYLAVALSQYCSNKKMDLFIEGSVTESMLLHLDEFIKIWSVWRPDLFSEIKIKARNVVPDSPFRSGPAVMVFSGGLDASFTLAFYKTEENGINGHNIRMGISIIGFDIEENDEPMIRKAGAGAERVLSEFNADNAVIKTNWRQSFCPDWLMGYDIGLACVLHTLTNSYSAGVISGGVNYLQALEQSPIGSHMSTDHFLGSNTFPVFMPGETHSRLEKAGFITDYPVILNNLRVCWQRLEEGINCGVCEKCVRTRLELMVYGVEPDIFNEPMRTEHIQKLGYEVEETFDFLEEMYLNMPKTNRFYDVVEKVYIREKKKLGRDAKLQIIKNKAEQIACLRQEMNDLKNTKSYRITKPLRFLRGLLK